MESLNFTYYHGADGSLRFNIFLETADEECSSVAMRPIPRNGLRLEDCVA